MHRRAGQFYFYGMAGRLALRPLPIPNLREIHAEFPDILLVLDELIPHHLNQERAPVPQLGQAVDDIHHQEIGRAHV